MMGGLVKMRSFFNMKDSMVTILMDMMGKKIQMNAASSEFKEMGESADSDMDLTPLIEHFEGR